MAPLADNNFIKKRLTKEVKLYNIPISLQCFKVQRTKAKEKRE